MFALTPPTIRLESSEATFETAVEGEHMSGEKNNCFKNCCSWHTQGRICAAMQNKIGLHCIDEKPCVSGHFL